MKIAIVGGGFYGSFLAHKLSENEKYKITLFEQDTELMARSATLNQSRLHRGLHYPRSLATIQQTNNGYGRFKKDFAKFVTTLDNNIYAIHEQSKTSLNDFEKIMKSFAIPLTTTIAPKLIRSPENYQAFISTDEMVIDLAQIKKYLTDELKKKITLNLKTKVKDLDSLQKQFDLVINTTYTNPNLNLPKEQHFSFYYEMAAMVCMDPPTKENRGITIVDGDFVSLFPNYNQQVTLSSVKYTPFFKSKNLKELEDCWKNRFDIAKKENVQEKIITDTKQYLTLNEIKNTTLWIAPKVKLDKVQYDDRPTMIRQHDKLISVFCSKLDSVYVILDKIKEVL